MSEPNYEHIDTVGRFDVWLCEEDGLYYVTLEGETRNLASFASIEGAEQYCTVRR